MPKPQQRGSKKRSGKGLLRTELHGRTYKPPPCPPVVQVGHWNHGTAVQRSTGDWTPNINDIANILRDQNGLFTKDTTDRIPISIRLLSVQFWYFDSLLPQPFQVLIRNLVNFGELARLQDFPARNQWGRVGYEWPASQQFVQHDHSDTTSSPLKIDVTSSAAWLLHVKVLWRPLNGLSYTEAATELTATRSSTPVLLG